MKSRYLFPGLALALSWPVAPPCIAQPDQARPAASSGAVVLTVDQAVSEAREANPDVRAAERRLMLAKTKISTAGSLDDPMFTVRDWQTPLQKPWDLNQAQLMFMVERTYTGMDKRLLRNRVAIENAQVAQDDLDTALQDVAVQVRKTCADLKRNADALKVHDRQAALLKEALAGAMAEYTTGKVPQTEVLRAQIAVTKLNEHMIELDQERDSARAQLNALLGRRPDEPIEIAGDYAANPDVPPLEQLESVAIDHRPELAALRQRVTTSREEKTLTHLAMKPDFTVGLGYMLMPTGSTYRNAYMAEFSMSLPRLNRDRHLNEVKQADAATAVTQADVEARSNAVFMEVRQAQIDVLAAQKRVKLYRDTLLPQADAAFKAATAAYQNNHAEFAGLIESQNVLLDVETALYTAQAAVDAGVARLERATGAPLSTPPTEKETGQ